MRAREMSLFLTLTLLTFLNAYRTRIVSLLLKLIPQDAQIKSKSLNIVALEKELSTISMVNEFAKHFKLQRRITKLKDEKKERVKNLAFKKMKIKYFLVTALYVISIGWIAQIFWSYGSESVAEVPAHWLWPVAQVFSWSNNGAGYISVPCWIAISSSASKTFAKIF